MARNSLYSNSPYSSRMGGGWIYSDGELYHYGRKGMKWYKTIFGGYDNPKSYTYDPDRGKWDNFKNQVSTGWQNVKGFTSNAVKNTQKYYTDPMARDLKNRQQARNGFIDNHKDFTAYKNSENFSSLKMTHLEKMMEKQYGDGSAVFKQMHNNPSLMNAINLMFQNAQYDVVSGVNKFLKKVGLDDEVDAILSKFVGDSDARKWQKGYDTAVRRANPTGSGITYPDNPEWQNAYETANRRANPTGSNVAYPYDPDKQKDFETAERHGNTNKYAGAGRYTGKQRENVIKNIINDSMSQLGRSGYQGVKDSIYKIASTSGISGQEVYNYFLNNIDDYKSVK
jgi:hypothetical protein